jgi:hypothetical protein
MVAWLTSIHSCTSCVEWDGSCVFDLQRGGHFLTHNFVVKAQNSHLCNRSRKTMKAKATLPSLLSVTVCWRCDGTCTFSTMHTVPVLWWHMHVISTRSVTIMWWHTHVIHHTWCPSTVMTHAGDQHVQCHNYVMAHTHVSCHTWCPSTVMTHAGDQHVQCHNYVMAHTHIIHHIWCPNTVTTMQVTSMFSVTSLMAHACDTAGLMSHFLEQLPSHITFKSGCYHMAVEDLQPFNPHNRD